MEIEKKVIASDHISVNLAIIKAEADFEGHVITLTHANQLIGNLMKYGGNILLDIGFEECAAAIYHEKDDEDVLIPKKYLPYIIDIVKGYDKMQACFRRRIIELLTVKE